VTTPAPVDLGNNDEFVDTVSSFEGEGGTSLQDAQDRYEQKLIETELQHKREKAALLILLAGVSSALLFIVCCLPICVYYFFCRPADDDQERLRNLRASRRSQRESHRITMREHQLDGEVAVMGRPIPGPDAGLVAGRVTVGYADNGISANDLGRPSRKTAPSGKAGRASEFGGEKAGRKSEREWPAGPGHPGHRITTLPADLRAVVLDDKGSDAGSSQVSVRSEASAPLKPAKATRKSTRKSERQPSKKAANGRTRESLNSME